MNSAINPNILTLTMNPVIDVSSSVDNIFPDHKLRCGPVREDPGGGGINVARAIRKLGGEALALHCSGGSNGARLRDLLEAEGVPQVSIEVKGCTRQDFTILENSTGQQYRFVMLGPTLTEHEWRMALDLIVSRTPAPEVIVASGSLPPGVPDDFYAQLARPFSGQKTRVIVDASGSALPLAVQAGVFMVKPSLRELGALSGRELLHEADQEQAAMALIESRRCMAVAVSLGAAGVLLATETGCERLRSPIVPVKSKVGAGDSMVAGIALGVSRGQSIRDAVRFGIAAGAAAVMNSGTELCHRADAERLLAQL